jgi:hypothetical protein
MRVTRIAPLALILGVAACGDGSGSSGFAGDYELVSITLIEGSCSGTGAQQTILPEDQYFQLTDEDIFGAPMVGFRACTAVAQCDADWDLFSSFGEMDGGGWGSTMSSASISGTGPCYLTHVQRELTRATPDSIVIVTTRYEDTDDTLTTAETCTYEAAEARGTTMPCTSKEERTGQAQP